MGVGASGAGGGGAADRESAIVAQIEAAVSASKCVIYSKTTCSYCQSTKRLFEAMRCECDVIELDQVPRGTELHAALARYTGQRTVPNVFVRGTHIGGNDATQAAYREGRLQEMLDGGTVRSLADNKAE